MAAALALLPHRRGDANVWVVWLFSRNDALGNIAVVIAGLFLHSSWTILRDARSDLREASELPA